MLETVKNEQEYSSELSQPSQRYQDVSRRLNERFTAFPSMAQYNLTLCHQKRFIWFRVAKVCTRTVLATLDSAGVVLDAVHPFNCHYPERLFADYFKFAFVRNPWDRLVSCWKNKIFDSNYFDLSDEKRRQLGDFSEFVSFVEQRDLSLGDPHLRLQSKLIDLNNLDFLGRFERFDEDFTLVMRKIGLDGVTASVRNRSNPRMPYRSVYDDDLKARVGLLYRRDIDFFGYDF